MWKGHLHAIYIASQPGEKLEPIAEVRAVPGKGLEGDRYFGKDTGKPGNSREVTLIEMEALEALERDHQLQFDLGDSRRNLITRGVPLNHLVGKRFQVGEVILRGVRLCEPCSHLAELTQPEALPALIHRGGLRAKILAEGILRTGDPISELSEP